MLECFVLLNGCPFSSSLLCIHTEKTSFRLWPDVSGAVEPAAHLAGQDLVKGPSTFVGKSPVILYPVSAPLADAWRLDKIDVDGVATSVTRLT